MDAHSSLKSCRPLSNLKCKMPLESASWQANIAGSIAKKFPRSKVDATTTTVENVTQEAPSNRPSVRKSLATPVSSVTSQLSLDAVLFPPDRGIDYTVGSKVRAKDKLGKWYNAKIVDIRPDDGQILVHFDYWNSRFDEWISASSSSRLMPINADVPKKRKRIEPFEVGDFVLVKLSHLVGTFPAQVVESLKSDTYTLLYKDGSEKVVHRRFLKKMSNEQVQQLDLVTFGQVKKPAADTDEDSDSQHGSRHVSLPSVGSSSVNDDKQVQASPKPKYTSLPRTAPFYYIKWTDPGKLNGKVNKILRRFIMTPPPYAVNSVVTVRFGRKLLKGTVFREPKWIKTSTNITVQRLTDEQWGLTTDRSVRSLQDRPVVKKETISDSPSSSTYSQEPKTSVEKVLKEASSVLLHSSTYNNHSDQTAAQPSQKNGPESLVTPDNNCQNIDDDDYEEPGSRSLLSDIRSLLATLVKQNDELIKAIKSKPTGPLARHDAVEELPLVPLVAPSVVLSEPTWRKPVFKSTQVLINKLTVQLASRSFFGDDVLIKSNVNRDDFVNQRRRLDIVKMQQLKEHVMKFVGAEEGDLEFCEQWTVAEIGLQDRIKNLRRRTVRMTTTGSNDGRAAAADGSWAKQNVGF